MEAVHMNKMTDILGNERNIIIQKELPLVDDEIGGTSISDILKKREEVQKQQSNLSIETNSKWNIKIKLYRTV